MRILKQIKKWRFKNLAFFILAMGVAIFLVDTPFLLDFIDGIGNFGYIGAFIAGAFIVSIFTVGPAMVVLFDLAIELNPVLVAIIGGFGGALGDFIIYKYLKDGVFNEMGRFFKKRKKTRFSRFISRIFKSKILVWMLPVIGAIAIISPFSDEVGLGLMGLSNIKKWQFVILTFVLDTIGILLITTLARSI